MRARARRASAAAAALGCWASLGERGGAASSPPAVAGCDLSEPDLALFLERTRAYYDTEVYHFADARRITEVLDNREDIVPVCAAAVLQALVLQLEEELIDNPLAYDSAMSMYVRYLHAGFQRGGLVAQDLEQWPLLRGLDRVEALRWRLAARAASSTSAMVMNFCAAADRFGVLHELEWLLQPPFGKPTADAAAGAEQASGQERGLLQDTDLYIYLVDAPKCQRPSDAVVEQLRGVCRSLHLIPYRGGPEREEQTAYFKFLSDHYDDLPDFTIFVHPDAPEHQGGEFLALRRALRLIRTGSQLAHEALQYFPLSLQLVVEPRRTWGSQYAAEWVQFWDQIYDKPWQQYRFVAPRCRWVLHPQAYIPGLLEGTSEGLSRALAKEACAAVEHCLGITCGTPPDSEEGRRDPEAERTGTCSARSGAGPTPLLESPYDIETSFVKSCASAGGSAHEDAVLQAAPHSATPKGEVPSAAYVEHRDAYLAEFVQGDALQRSEEATRVRCEALGVACGGYTCDAARRACTVRAGMQPLRSPMGESSFLRVAEEERPQAAAAAPQRSSLQAAPERGALEAVFQSYMGSQAVVHKDRVRLWPRERLASLAADGVFCSKFTGYFEALWHAMFGEPLSQLPRERDPRLPLFLKWSTFTFYSYGDEGVV